MTRPVAYIHSEELPGNAIHYTIWSEGNQKRGGTFVGGDMAERMRALRSLVLDIEEEGYTVKNWDRESNRIWPKGVAAVDPADEVVAYYTRVYHGPFALRKHQHATTTTLPITQHDLCMHGRHTPAALIAFWNGVNPSDWTYYLEG